MASGTISRNPPEFGSIGLYTPSSPSAVTVGADITLSEDVADYNFLKVTFTRTMNTGAAYRGYVIAPIINGGVDINTWDVYLGGKDYGGQVKFSATETTLNVAETSFSTLYLYRVIGVK